MVGYYRGCSGCWEVHFGFSLFSRDSKECADLVLCSLPLSMFCFWPLRVCSVLLGFLVSASKVGSPCLAAVVRLRFSSFDHGPRCKAGFEFCSDWSCCILVSFGLSLCSSVSLGCFCSFRCFSLLVTSVTSVKNFKSVHNLKIFTKKKKRGSYNNIYLLRRERRIRSYIIQ